MRETKSDRLLEPNVAQMLRYGAFRTPRCI